MSEENTSAEEPKTERPKWIVPVALLIAAIILFTIVWFVRTTPIDGKIDNMVVFNQTLNNSQVQQLSNVTLLDISADMCKGLDNASRAANITTTRYYMSAQYCVWEVQGYNKEYYVHCENAERKAEILIRPINMTLELVQTRFPECQVLPVVREK